MRSKPPVIILLHGAWHTAACWNRLTPLLLARNLRVFTPNLPGHRANGVAAPGKISLKTYAQQISQLIGSMESPVSLVGHSMSGVLISELAEMLPTKIDKLVYLAAYLPADGQSLFDLMAAHRRKHGETAIEQALRMSADKKTSSLSAQDIKTLFYNRCNEHDASVALAHTCIQPTLPLAGKVRLSNDNFGTCSRTYISCTDDLVIPATQREDMLSVHSCDAVISLDTDHSPFWSSPEDLADVLLNVVGE